MSLCLVWMLNQRGLYLHMLEGRFGWESVWGSESDGQTLFSAAGVLHVVISPLLFSAFKKLLFVRSTKTILHVHF